MKNDPPQNANPPAAIGYVRVSTEEQAAEGVSLEAQRAKVAAYCGLHGLSLAQTYADEGLSGKRADNRPGLQSAIAHACQSEGVLIVYSLSRLARSTRDAIDIAERLAKSDADLVSITEKMCAFDEPHLQFHRERRQDGFRLTNGGVHGDGGKSDQGA